MNEIFYTLGISLFDSLTTTLQIVIFVLLLTTDKPIRNALGYLSGLSGAYFACGALGYLALDQLRPLLARLMPSNDIPNPVYYQAEFLTGLVMVAMGFWYFFRKKKTKHSRWVTWLLSKLQTMKPWFAFVVGFLFSLSCFPGSIPYLAALVKYSTLQMSYPGALAYILLYNFGYALPMLLLLGVYLFFQKEAREHRDSLHETAHRLSDHLTAWTFAGFGFFSMLDAGCYFAFGQALLKGRLF